MSIKKRVVPISFSCEPGDDKGLTYDIIYYPNSDDGFDIEISGQFRFSDDNICKDSVIYPISLFVEIVDFLRGEGLIKSDGIKNIEDLDKIDIKKESDVHKLSLPKVYPISSFDDKDISKDELDEKIEENEKIELDDVIDNQVEETNENQNYKNILKRPVIKTRVDDSENDPLKAERDAQILRNKMMKNNKKVIKRKEE